MSAQLVDKEDISNLMSEIEINDNMNDTHSTTSKSSEKEENDNNLSNKKQPNNDVNVEIVTKETFEQYLEKLLKNIPLTTQETKNLCERVRNYNLLIKINIIDKTNFSRRTDIIIYSNTSNYMWRCTWSILGSRRVI